MSGGGEFLAARAAPPCLRSPPPSTFLLFPRCARSTGLLLELAIGERHYEDSPPPSL